MANLLKTFALLLSALILVGCWDGSELSDRGFVTTIGIDIDKDTDEIETYKVSLEMPQLTTDNDNPIKDVKTNTHKSLNRAISGAGSSTEHEIFLGHMKALVCGEELLKNGEMFRHVLRTLSGDHNASRTLLVLATKGPGSDVIEAESVEESLLGAYISNFFKKKNPSTAHRQTLDSLSRYFSEGKTAILPRIEASDEGLTFSGAAVMSDYTLRGWLSEEELLALTWLSPEAKHLELDVSSDDHNFHIEVDKHKSRFIFFVEDHELLAKIVIDLEGDLAEVPNTANAGRYIIELKARERIHEDLSKVFHALYVEMGVDGFNLERELEKNYPHLHRRYIKELGINTVDIPILFDVSVVIDGADNNVN